MTPMRSCAELQPHETGQPYRICVQSALSDELVEDLTDQGFAAAEGDGSAVVNGIEIRFVEVAAETDELALYGFLGFWNEQQAKE